MTTAIAILGLACEFPGSSTPEALWETALRKHRWFRNIPSVRLPEEYMDLPGNGPDTTKLRRAAVLEGYRFPFDRLLIGEKDLPTADLAHWLALDCAIRALDDTGLGDHLPKDSTCVIVGNCLTGESSRAEALRLRWPYVRKTLMESGTTGTDDEWAVRETHFKARLARVESRTLAGALANVIAGRISLHNDLKGGCYSVDAACASSLVAVAQASSMLLSGEVDCALVGGVDISLDPLELIGFSKAGALSSGDMKIFDKHRSGFTPGEGCGFAVLMRTDHPAVKHASRIRGYIRGWAVSSDGRHDLTAPSSTGQRLVLERAYRRAGFGIETVPLFEAHGTGTEIGDLVETETLVGLLSGSTQSAAIGSIKANIGHTKAAAGIAGLIKAALAVESHILPPITGCETPMDELRNAKVLRILNEPEEWPANQAARAGVSAFGFGGVNAHVVLEAATPSGSTRSRRGISLTARRSPAPVEETFFFDGATVEELIRSLSLVRSFAPFLAETQLAAVGGATARAISTGAWRAAVIAGSADALARHLDRVIQHLQASPDDPLLAAPVFAGRKDDADSSERGWQDIASPAEAFVTRAVQDPSALFANREIPAFDLNWKPLFLVNPCERPLRKMQSTIPEPRPQTPTTVLEAVHHVLRNRKGEGFKFDLRQNQDPTLSSLGVDSLSIFDLVAAVEGYGYKERTLAHNLMTVNEFASIFDVVEAPQAPTTLADKLAPWVRSFDVAWDPAPPLSAGDTQGVWNELSAGSQNGQLRAGAKGLLVRCGSAVDSSSFDDLLLAIRTVPPGQTVAFLDCTGQWSGFARTLAMEQPNKRVLYVRHPSAKPPTLAQVEAELLEPFSFREVQYLPSGERQMPRIVLADPLSSSGNIPLGPDDVVLVTGGAKGITAECVNALASVTGVRLALIGRSLQSKSADVQIALERLAQQNIVHQYWAADIGNVHAIAPLIAEVEQKLGIITVIIHGAAVNDPGDIASLNARAIDNHTLAKVKGLSHLLSAVPPWQLKMVIAFGSVIARSGYPYSAAYAFANDTLAYQLETYKLEHPHIRCQVLDWTAWAETGMGSGLQAIDSLKKNGVAPLSNEAGRQAFLSILGKPAVSFRPILAGRLPQTPTFTFAGQPPPIEGWPDAKVISFIPALELVARLTVSLKRLPWLAGHTSRDGILILPGTLAIGIMESVANALSSGQPFHCLRDIVFDRPVRIPSAATSDLCIQAIDCSDGTVLCRLYEESGALSDPFASMLCVRTDAQPHHIAASSPANKLSEQDGRVLAQKVYEHLLFHRAAFQVISHYSYADATRSVFHIPSGIAGESLVQKLTIARDAVLHGIQVCVPKELLLPVRIGSILRKRVEELPSCTVDAIETSFTQDAYFYKLSICDNMGEIIEEWRDLEFRCYSENSAVSTLPASLAAIVHQRESSQDDPSEDYFEYRHIVGFKETNVAGNVYYTNHIEWQGRCREMFLKAYAPDILDDLESGQLLLVTVSCSCDYEAELRAFDEVAVRMRLDSAGNDWLSLSFEYWRVQAPSHVRIAKGLQKIATRRRTPNGLQPMHLPESLVNAFRPYTMLQGKQGSIAARNSSGQRSGRSDG